MYWLTKLARHKVMLSLLAVFALSLVMAPVAYGDDDDDDDDDTQIGDFGLTEFMSGGSELGNQSIESTIAQIINVALSLLGVVAVVIILAGGFKWMTAGGNEDKVAEARKLIFAGVIGLAIILSAFAIATFVLNNLADATGTGQQFDPTEGAG